MDQILAGLKPFFDALGVQPWMYPVLLASGIGHQYAKGTIRRWTQEWSFVSAVVVAVVFGVLSVIDSRLGWLEGGTRTIILLAACLLSEGAMDKLADFVPWVPKANQWTKP